MNKCGHTGIYLASAAGRTGVVKNLLQLGASVAVECGHHGTPLKGACANDHVEIVRLLLDLPDDVNTKEGPFGTPLRAASLMGHDSTVRTLLALGAEVNTIEPFGDALPAAAMKGHLPIATTLNKHNSNLNNHGGYLGIALQAATYRGRYHVVKALLDAGASIDERGLFGDAVSAAVSAGND
ncbi:ankyrin, partial [Ophiobolus disseminans]